MKINHHPLTISHQRGDIATPLLVITATFIVAIYAMLFLISLQLDFSHRQVASEESLHIAEAGINYYRWHLAHDPENYTGETGTHTYTDPQGSTTGQYELEVTPPQQGSSIVTIRSTGQTTQYPGVTRTIEAQYGRPSFANFVFLNNGSIWYGEGLTIHGNVHSNNGIRMDGINTGIVSSSQDEYRCGSETGCHPPQWRPGVWGSGPGGDLGLWQFPVNPIDFDAVSFDFAQMKTSAQTEGLYLPESGSFGYHIIFNANGTFNVLKVLNKDYIEGYSSPGEGLGQDGQGGCRRRYQLITNETSIGTYNVSNNPIIFIEDHAWVEGTVNGRVTVVTAGFPVTSRAMNIWIPNNIVYADYNSNHALGLIAQNDIYIARDVPNDFHVDGAIMAQGGRIIRHGYWSGCGGPTNALRNSLVINGALISYNKSYWNFNTDSDPEPESGFLTRTINYNSDFLYNPPPYFPVSGVYQFISWKEE